MRIVYFLISFSGISAVTGLDELCPPRQLQIPQGRECQKPCERDRDCRSRRKACRCDGICGRSCIRAGTECVVLNHIPNGLVDMRPNNKFGAVAQYACNEGYKLRGDPARVCQGDEQWSGTEPQCFQDLTEKVICSAPPEIPNAVHNGFIDQNAFEIGKMLQYECLPDFQMNRDGVTRAWCVKSGEWVGPTMTCTRKGAWCPRLQDIDNGWVEQDTTTSQGGIARYTCKLGYFLAGRNQRTCLSSGEWDGVTPSCEKVTCKRPPKLDHAAHDGDPAQEMYPSGGQLLYTCAYGYHPDGNPQVMCNGEGNWVGLTLTCTPKSCGYPGEIDKGHRIGFVFTFPNKVTYQCMEGYTLQGENYKMCQADGTWSGKTPTCEPVRCPTLKAPVFGRMYGTGNDYGAVIRFECEDKYKVMGSTERRCQADRSWSGELTRCEEINCGWPTPFYNGYLIGHDTSVGGTLFFSCKIHATFEGTAFQTRCLETGEWSDPPPMCWSQCQIPVIPNATLEGGRPLTYVNHKTVIQFQCKGGLVANGGTGMKCDNGTWSVTPECAPAPCMQPPPHVHNGMRVFMGQDHGLRAKYVCFAGYMLTGMNSTYLMCNFGQWEGGRPHCEEFFCPNPYNVTGDILHGTINKKVDKGRFSFKKYMYTIRHGDRIEFQCDAGYRVDGHAGATCVDGQWQPPLGNGSSICIPAVHPPFRHLWEPIDNLRN
ncbi:protein lev-9-like isoform X4 [Mya arenaria]|uniref:protein lev-9-like isoform X4 n=1 Tax=Mya arenaria TaxID=6604 RepID=UPI0022E5EB85|nr:protein lev-9-like isoform X4 [Mya arenaria]